MRRRTFSRAYKIEAVKLVTECGVSVARACRDLDVAKNVFRRWLREAAAAPASAFPGNGRQRDELAEIAALKKEVAKLKAERDILKKRPPPSRGKRQDVRLHGEAPAYLAGQLALRGAGGLAFRLPRLAQPADQRAGHA
jgi:transposase